ncbi:MULTISPECIES: SH3 domain-containing protein [Paracoccus]|jgi:uncharacterized protein YraI|uniref:SH3 domain-containing protein n=1 Tax=Paracoccus lutimaris TaxID=1490030 RepID=A0A368YDN2_9RHOB|nr:MULTISPECIES: SH3 domain-containing protein [Paracoccus]RCW78350.1 SH3 domain-containing protein [Paracoccus lutimaris]TRW91444.1 SH3 domain-containing protein [Paracoccus sp. M683]
MRTRLAALLALMIATGCTVGSGAVVKGAGPDDLLKLREGPGLNHKIIIGLPDGTRLVRQNCVTNNGKLWCKVALADRPGVSGYVSAEYLALR